VAATVGSFTDTVTDAVTGVTIPDNDIADQLLTLYANVTVPGSSFTPATPQLMTQVASRESSYEQFTDGNLYDFGTLWPHESGKPGAYRAGKHIGLTQVPVTMGDAWDWLQNTDDGVLMPSQNSFQEKLENAYSLSVSILKKYPTPAGGTPLTISSCQLEEMALELYGDHPGGTHLGAQYYIPRCTGGTGTKCTGGSWQWLINTPGNYCGVCYVWKVRTTAPIGGGSTSSCPASPLNSADPPTLSGCEIHHCPSQ